MIIDSVNVSGFGMCGNVRLDKISTKLNVFHGPNEAGKSTLLEFIRWVLYGNDAHLTRDYLHSGGKDKVGGSLDFLQGDRRFQVRRTCRLNEQGGLTEQVVLSDDQQHRIDVARLPELLSGIKADVFRHVYAVGLRELQELGTLDDSDSARLLYDISGGADHGALRDALKGLASSRQRLWSGSTSGRIPELQRQMQILEEEIQQRCLPGSTYNHSVRRRQELDEGIAQTQQQKVELEAQSCLIEAAVTLQDRWQKRNAVERELGNMAVLPNFPIDGLRQLGEMNSRLKRGRRHLAEIKKQSSTLRNKLARRSTSGKLIAHAPHIAMLRQQKPRIQAISQQIEQIQNRLQVDQRLLAEEERKLGVDVHSPRMMKLMASPKLLAPARQAGKTLRRAKRELALIEETATREQESTLELANNLKAALKKRGVSNLSKAVEAATLRVTQLRNRIQLNERIAELHRHRRELEEQSEQLATDQAIQPHVLIALGAVFITGGFLLLYFVIGSLLPASLITPISGLTATFGALLVACSVVGKLILEHKHEQAYEECLDQLELLHKQIGQTEQERQQVDARLPSGNGPMTVRLQKAEQELADLEELLPIDARHGVASMETNDAGSRVDAARRELEIARRRWKTVLSETGLPSSTTPSKVRQLAERSDHLAQLKRRIEETTEQLSLREQELQGVTQQIENLLLDASTAELPEDPIEQLDLLNDRLQEETRHRKIRKKLRKQLQVLQRRRDRLRRRLLTAKMRRRALLTEAGAVDEQQFRQLSQRYEASHNLQQQRLNIQREIEHVLGNQFTEEMIAKQFDMSRPVELKEQWERLTQELDQTVQKLSGMLEERGRVLQQLEDFSNSTELDDKKVELAMLHARFAQGSRDWQVHALTEGMLRDVRDQYEQSRQPETLQHASQYLSRFTQGRYTRVWTRLGERTLVVDDSDGGNWRTEQLSRGSREQLLLSLRLGLVATMSQRGIELPLVLDDVLVNFDTKRTVAAAEAIAEFAARGHQLLLFTCHEQVKEIFQSLHATVRELPEMGSVPLKASQQTANRAAAEDPLAGQEVEDELIELPPEPKPRGASRRKKGKQNSRKRKKNKTAESTRDERIEEKLNPDASGREHSEPKPKEQADSDKNPKDFQTSELDEELFDQDSPWQEAPVGFQPWDDEDVEAA